MRLKLNVSQIFLPNSKQAQNFVSAYEEVVKADEFVNVFVIVEVKGERKSPATKKQEMFEKLTGALARAIKQTYAAEMTSDEATFEKALTNANSQLSLMAQRGIVGWYKKMNALVGVYAKNTLHVSVTGSATAFLFRHHEFSHVTEGVSSGPAPHPLKTFSNFASGTLQENDFVIFSTSSLYNYVSMEKIRQALTDLSLDDASREVIAAIKHDALPDEAFATFLLKAGQRLEIPDSELHPLMAPSSHMILDDKEILSARTYQRTWDGAKKVAALLGNAIAGLFHGIVSLAKLFLGNRSARRQLPDSPQLAKTKGLFQSKKKYFISAFAVLVVVLIFTLVSFNLANNQKTTHEELTRLLDESSQRVVDAEAALIYNDQSKALTAVNSARDNLAAAAKIADWKKEAQLKIQYDMLVDKSSRIFDSMNKISKIDQVENIGQFSNTPDRLIKIDAGFLGFNSFTDSMENWVSASRNTVKISLNAPVPENLSGAVYWPNLKSEVFLGVSGVFYRLNANQDALTPLVNASSTLASDHYYQGLKIYTNKIYTLDRAASQIVKISPAGENFSSFQPWLKKTADLDQAVDLAVDGSLYVLYPEAVDKYSKGEKQTFSLAALPTPLKQASKIFTTVDSQLIYIADPPNSRIAIFNKQGAVAVQLVSDKFSDLKDFWVDEPNKMMYVLNGNDLIRFKF